MNHAAVVLRSHQTDSGQRTDYAVFRAAEAFEMNAVLRGDLSRVGLLHQFALAAKSPVHDG